MVMANCLFLGILTQTFIVDIKPEKKVSHLRELIHDTNMNTFDKMNFSHKDLKLYEVAISIDEKDKKYNILKNKLDTKIDVENDLGVFLNPLPNITEHFKTPNNKQIHVIVTLPSRYFAIYCLFSCCLCN